MANYSRIQKVLGVLGLWVGSKSSPVQVAGPTGTLYQNGTALTPTATEINLLSGLLVSAAEINRACDNSTRVVNVAVATLAATQADHDGKIVTLNKADGIAVTLPAATGSGARLTFVVGTTITSSSTTIKVTGDDIMVGNCIQGADGGNTSAMYETTADTDTITLDGSTTGGIKGDTIELMDIAANTWLVRMVGAATGEEATPFSASVT